MGKSYNQEREFCSHLAQVDPFALVVAKSSSTILVKTLRQEHSCKSILGETVIGTHNQLSVKYFAK